MIDLVLRYILPAAYTLLPPRMNSQEATAMLLAIGLQESRFMHRAQVRGPARGWWQFEAWGGVEGVLEHPSTRGPIRAVLTALRYSPDVPANGVHPVLAHNDVLAACFARCLLWTAPGRLPSITESDFAWELYLDTWRPGKPHPGTWAAFYREAWARVTETTPVPPGQRA